MAHYWFLETTGATVGPVGADVIRELAAVGRLSAGTQVSRDGGAWTPLAQLPELAAALPSAAAPGAAAPHPEQQRAAEIRQKLAHYQRLSDAELLGVGPSADLRTMKQAFLALAKDYHPARLAKTAHPDLIRACMEMFQFLSGRMVLIERQASAAAARSTPTPPPAKPAAPERKKEEIAAVHELQGGRVEIVIPVGVTDVGMFLDHRVINLSTGGIFVATERPLAMGARMELILKVKDPPHDIRTRATVVFESRLPDPKHPSGIGLRLEKLGEADRQALDDLIRRGKEHRERAKSQH